MLSILLQLYFVVDIRNEYIRKCDVIEMFEEFIESYENRSDGNYFIEYYL